ncbi:MAG: septum formation initiator family protein [Muribaculaceae bacterium]|nr:septum formation initiator family protein [Muribaculaceae bacterium]
MEKIKRIFFWCKRYFSFTLLAVVAFIVFILFFNEHSVMKTMEYKREIEELKAQIKLNRDSTEYYRKQNDRLKTDPATMEKIVREQYHMQRADEDVYIIVKE